MATLVESLGFDPFDHVEASTVKIMYLLRVHWLAECATRWIPDGVDTYDKSIAQIARKL